MQVANNSSAYSAHETGTEIDLGRGFGGQLVWMTPIVDLTAGLQTRRYGSNATTEGTVGVRWRIYDDPDATPYFLVDLRHSRHESHASEFFNGLALGFGFLFHLGPHLYADANLAWERTSGIHFPDGAPRHNEAVFQLGLGVMW